MLVGIQATCQQCRQAKVKCDMGLPYGRCVRLGKACLPSAPSRRGQKRKAAPAAAAAGAAAEDYPAAHLHNVVGELVDGAKAAGTALRGLHPGMKDGMKNCMNENVWKTVSKRYEETYGKLLGNVMGNSLNLRIKNTFIPVCVMV